MKTTLYLSKPGIMSCAGKNIEELWQSVTSGNQDGIKKVTTCTGEEFYAARIADSLLKPAAARYDMRIIRIEEAALNQIADDINLALEKYGPERIAVCLGSCDNGTEFSIAGHRKFFSEGSFPKEYNIEMQGADYVATYISERFGIKGPSATFSTACSSSAGAMIKAAEMIMGGLVDAAIVGGIDIASDTTLVGFNALEAVSAEITNPFSKNRHGITLGDGAAFFILSREPIGSEEAENCVKLLGWGESADAYHMTSPDPSGAGAQKAIQRALESAEIEPADVGYINMHGTGTKFNDSMEAKAIASIFGQVKVPVSTTKPVTGHTLGAAAALETAICWAALKEKKRLPLQIWDGQRDPELEELNIIDKNNAKSNDAKKLKVCLSNSFAFGGANACLVVGI
ncbi:MAG: 3-oxoacyl-ACP synthase [Treponema sp.]|nr:3-oxoacyl-ACP synthase [Treponema sp.]